MPDQTPKPTTELDTEQAAAELNISVRRVRQLIKAGRLTATYHSVPDRQGYYTIRRDALEAVRNRPNGRPRKIRDLPE